MKKYNFYYDESEHSRKINYKTITADNYYDNFITVIVGWDAEYETEFLKKYTEFEKKYDERKSKGELKSTTIKQSQLQYGFQSMNDENIGMIEDFLSLFDQNILLYFSVTSKVEYVIMQLFESYKNTMFADMDALKYVITKALITYKPKEILECMYGNTEELVDSLKKFFRKKIEQNKENLTLKKDENKAFEQAINLLDDVGNVRTIDWNYNIAFIGFVRFLKNKNINDYTITIDKEGECKNTLKAAKKVGLKNVAEVDSINNFGIRVADMMAGLISKFLKSLHKALGYQLPDEEVVKKVLDQRWFQVNDWQLKLYKKMYYVISELNIDWYKAFAGIYADDLVALVALLEYMHHFHATDEIVAEGIDVQGEYFNRHLIEKMERHFERIYNKLPIECIKDDSEEYFLNQRGAKVFFDSKKQPLLNISNEKDTYTVLSVGFNKEGAPLVTVLIGNEPICYRLPEELSNWACELVSVANMGMNLFPTEVTFSKIKGKYYVDIL